MEDYLNRHFPGFLALPQVSLSLSLFHSSNLGTRFLFKGVGYDTLGVQKVKFSKANLICHKNVREEFK